MEVLMARYEDDFLKEFRRMQSRLNAMLGGGTSRPATGKIFIPPGDVYETQDSFFICLEVAGADRSTLEVIVRDRTLFLSGERKLKAPAHAKVHQMEIDCGHFHKAFELPCAVKEENIRSRYEDGMLIIEFEKPETCKIEVKPK
jgi:HSP20 family protein